MNWEKNKPLLCDEYHIAKQLLETIIKKLENTSHTAIKSQMIVNNQTPLRSSFNHGRKYMKYILLFASLLLIGCSKSQDIVTYTIKKGDHYCDKSTFDNVGNKLAYEILFDETAIYHINSIDSLDINKLFGFTTCNLIPSVHTNSVRFGWVYSNGMIDIYGYVYENKERSFFKITTVGINEWHKYKLEHLDNHIVFIVDETVYIRIKKNKCISKCNYKLFPYFGGDEKAPHDIKIYFKTL